MTSSVRTADPPPPARILVVDDTAASRYITTRWLRRAGHEVVVAGTGDQALSMVHDHPFELVILDARLPDMSGFDVCERIKAHPDTAALPVIHISASFIETEDRAQGADAFLTEPVNPGELIATVQAALRYSRARIAAERLAHRLTQLTDVSLAINGAQTFPELVAAVTHGATLVFGGTAKVLVAASATTLCRGATPGAGQRIDVHIEPVALLEQLAAAHLGTRGGAEVGTARGFGRDTIAVLARTKPDQPALCVALPAETVTTPEDRNLLRQLGQMGALAAQGLRAYDREHRLALTLQRGLLPSHLPQHPDLPVAVRYIPASANTEVGGDFYEVAELDGAMLIAIGDVTGHSIEAATIMGEVRHALRAYAAEGHGPAQIIHQLDKMLCRFHPTGYTTLCILLVDLHTGAVTLANAGHLPPLIVDHAGARYLPLGGPLLGVGVDRPNETRIPLPPGTTVVLMTDGLVERRGVPLDEDLETLRASMIPGENVEHLCDRLLARFGRNNRDDIALLAFHRNHPTGPPD